MLNNSCVPNMLEERDRVKPNEGIWRSARNSIIIGLLGGGVFWSVFVLNYVLISGVLGQALGDWATGGYNTLDLSAFWSVLLLNAKSSVQCSSSIYTELSYTIYTDLGCYVWGEGFTYGLIAGLVSGLLAWLLNGGRACIQHMILRVLLWRTKVIPWNYPHFLDEAADRILLRKVGGGYIFVHRLLLDYFATLEALPVFDEPAENRAGAIRPSGASRTPAGPTAPDVLPEPPSATLPLPPTPILPESPRLLPCGHEQRPNARFCSVCGAPVPSPDESEGDVANIPFFPNPRAEKERARQAEEERRRLAEEAERTRRMEEEKQRRIEEERARQAEEERVRKAREEEQAIQVKQPEPVPVVPVSETTDTSQAQQSTGMAIPVPVIPFSQKVTVGGIPADTSQQQLMSEVLADIPAQPHDVNSWLGNEITADLTAPLPSLSPQVSIPVVRDEPKQVRLVVSRRTVVVGLAGLALVGAAGGGLIWLAHSQRPTAPTALASPTAPPTSVSTPTASPSPTAPPTSVSTPTASSSPTPLTVGSTLYTYTGHSDSVSAVAWSPDGKRIASGSADKTVQVWDAANGGHVFTYTGHSGTGKFGGVSAVAWSPNGQRIASGSGNPNTAVQVWDAANGGHVFTYRGHAGLFFVSAVAWSPDGKSIASVGFVPSPPTLMLVGEVQVWAANTGTDAWTYMSSSYNDNVNTVAWSPDGRRIASGSGEYQGNNHTVQVWDAADGANVFTYRGHSNAVFAVAWSPDGKRIASGSDDNTVQVWDAADGANVFTYRGHSNAVFAVAWSPDGKRIASGSNDGTVQVWDAANGGHVFTYTGHSGSVSAVAWSPDGKRIASGSYDKTVRVWQAP